MTILVQKIKTFFNLIKFEHSIFALPFAYLGLFLAEGGFPRFSIFLWVTIAMVAVRTAGMCLNRLIDERIDQENPRTQDRARQIHFLKRPVLWIVTACALILFVASAAKLNHLCLLLTPIPIFLIWLYPHLKKFTWLSHFVLGIILGIAPYAGWLSSAATWSWIPLLLTVAVTSWVCGFDMFYALQDVEFDTLRHLRSYPVQFGIQRTFQTIRLLHAITVFALAVFGFVLRMGIWYWAGWLIVVGLIVKEHRLVGRFGLSKINEAFFNMNAWVSVVIFIAMTMELTVH